MFQGEFKDKFGKKWVNQKLCDRISGNSRNYPTSIYTCEKLP